MSVAGVAKLCSLLAAGAVAVATVNPVIVSAVIGLFGQVLAVVVGVALTRYLARRRNGNGKK